MSRIEARSHRGPSGASQGLAAGALLACVAIVTGCAGPSSGGSGGRSATRHGSMRLEDALSAALSRRGTIVPFSVELVTIAGRSNLSIGAFDGATPSLFVFATDNGAFVDERPAPPIDDDEAASLAALRARLAASSTTLRTALRMVESRYVMADVSGVALLVRDSRLLVRVLTGTADASVEHYHEASSGEATDLMDAGTDAGRHDAGPPDAGPRDAGPPDAGPPDAGLLDAGRDAGARDAGRRR